MKDQIYQIYYYRNSSLQKFLLQKLVGEELLLLLLQTVRTKFQRRKTTETPFLLEKENNTIIFHLISFFFSLFLSHFHSLSLFHTLTLLGLPIPAISTALCYFDGIRSARLPHNLLQAQRDYFGAHMYERIDKKPGENFHTNWTGQGGNTTSTVYNAKL